MVNSESLNGIARFITTRYGVATEMNVVGSPGIEGKGTRTEV
jgi:hypothetical protein